MMSGEERAMWIDRAIDENDEEIQASSSLGEAARIVAEHCDERAGFDDITTGELMAGFDRKVSRINGESEQIGAAGDDLGRLLAVTGRAGFEKRGMSMGEILAEMDRRGELSDGEKREAAGAFERLPTVSVPPDHG
jgi:hypothetical protein